MAKDRTVNFKFGRGNAPIMMCMVSDLPAFYLYQSKGRLDGIVFSDKEFAMNLKAVAECAIRILEAQEKALGEVGK